MLILHWGSSGGSVNKYCVNVLRLRPRGDGENGLDSEARLFGEMAFLLPSPEVTNCSLNKGLYRGESENNFMRSSVSTAVPFRGELSDPLPSPLHLLLHMTLSSASSFTSTIFTAYFTDFLFGLPLGQWSRQTQIKIFIPTYVQYIYI